MAPSPWRRLPLVRARPFSSTSAAPKSLGIANMRHWRRNINVARLLSFTKERPDVVINGSIRSIRKQKKRCFAAIDDGSSIDTLQALMTPEQAESLTIGTAVRLRGHWKAAPFHATGQTHELHVDKIDVLGPSDPATFPLQKKYHTPEYLRTIQHLRLRTPFNSMMVRFRADIIRYTSQYYEDHKFIQTHPPIITSSDCEGAGEVFGLRTSDEKESSSNLFFRSPKYLTVSSQLHLEALAQSVGKVWTLSPTFRAEKSDTARHLSEFYMLEAELNAVDRLQALLSSVENLLRNIAYRLLNNKYSVAHELLAARRHDENGQEIDTAETAELLSRRWAAMAADGWPRITYTQAISILQNSGQNFEHKPVWGAGLQAEHERYLANTVGRAGGVGGPVFVTKYPRSLKPFYMLPSNTGLTMEELSSPDVTVDCFDLLVPDACEIAGGSMREHRLDYLLHSMRENGLVPPAPEDGSEATDFGNLGWYVDLRRWGSAPHGGYGIGFDRLLGYLAGVNNIREVVAFPRWAGRCDC